MIDKMQLSNQAYQLRKELGEDDTSPINIGALAQSIENLTLIYYPLGKNISGICYKGEKSNVIAINSQMSLGRQRFSLAHELYHLKFEEESTTTFSMTQIGNGNENEKKADIFASYLLVPQQSLYNNIQKIKKISNKNKLEIEDIIKMEQHYGVSHKAMMYRLKSEGEITSEQEEKISTGIIELATKLGYDTSLYYPSDEKNQIKVLGYYIGKTEELLNKELISQGKYEELLLDAFRSDIVYGVDDLEENID